MGSKRSYFTCNFFIFLEEDFALPLMQLLLLIFSKRLDNLLSVCGALDFFWSCRASIYRKYAFRDLLPSPFSLLYFSISSRIVFFNTLSISFLSAFPFLYFPFAFADRKCLKTSNFYMCVLDFIYTCHLCFI